MINILAVFIGGGIGATCRYLVGKLSVKILGLAYTGTFFVNILGCSLIGYIFGLTMEKTQIFPPVIKLFTTVGFLGGLTTFSTFSCETFCFLKDGKILQGLLYAMASLCIGLCATFAGYMLGKS